MAFFRQYIAPFFILIIFLIALVSVSARLVLPTDMAAPAPTGEVSLHVNPTVEPSDYVPSTLSVLVNGLPDDMLLVQ
jgi:hypothetical protein